MVPQNIHYPSILAFIVSISLSTMPCSAGGDPAILTPRPRSCSHRTPPSLDNALQEDIEQEFIDFVITKMMDICIEQEPKTKKLERVLHVVIKQLVVNFMNASDDDVASVLKQQESEEQLCSFILTASGATARFPIDSKEEKKALGVVTAVKSALADTDTLIKKAQAAGINIDHRDISSNYDDDELLFELSPPTEDETDTVSPSTTEDTVPATPAPPVRHPLFSPDKQSSSIRRSVHRSPFPFSPQMRAASEEAIKIAIRDLNPAEKEILDGVQKSTAKPNPPRRLEFDRSPSTKKDEGHMPTRQTSLLTTTTPSRPQEPSTPTSKKNVLVWASIATVAGAAILAGMAGSTLAYKHRNTQDISALPKIHQTLIKIARKAGLWNGPHHKRGPKTQ